MAEQPHLLLFDIDGTLVDTGGAGMRALVQAVGELYPDRVEAAGGSPQLDLAGSTDSGLAMQIFAELGVTDSPAERQLFFGSYLSHLRANLGEPGTNGTLLAGVTALLDHLAPLSRAGEVMVGLLTGNIAEGARVKMDYYGVAPHFPFGSFGDDHHDRDRLGPIAVRRAGDHLGHDLGAAPVTVIGDTPKDIRCARAFGARVLAVASGGVERQALAAHDPDVLLPDLADLDKVISALGLD